MGNMAALLGQGRLFLCWSRQRGRKMKCLLESKEKILDLTNNNSYY